MEGVEKIPNRHSQIEQSLLSNEITLDTFLDKLIDWDQEETTRSAALDNIKLLESLEIVQKFTGSDQESKYYDSLGFFYFHKAQILEGEALSGLEEFKKALEYSERGKIYDDGGDWQRYIESTIAYLEGDLEKLKTSFKSEDSNSTLLQNFVAGLEERGSPDYTADYSKSRD